jgi:hypothetical protein
MDEPFGALDALTREQLYGDIQRIWQERQKTIVFVTHNVREATCLGDRVVLFSPHPGRIQEQFQIDLPRPRDINSVDLAIYRRDHARLEATLAARTGGGGGMTRRLLVIAFFAALIGAWETLVRLKIWSPVLVPSPVSVARYIVDALQRWHAGTCVTGDDAPPADRLRRWVGVRIAAGTPDRAVPVLRG